LENLWRGGKARGRDKGKEGEKARGVEKARAEEGSVGREDDEKTSVTQDTSRCLRCPWTLNFMRKKDFSLGA
jgi:hypothetical protein